MDAVVSSGAGRYVVDALQVKDIEMISLTLQFIEMFLRSHSEGKIQLIDHNGLTCMEQLQCSETDEIRNRAHYLVKTYFKAESQI